jgi:hypothetical protein
MYFLSDYPDPINLLMPCVLTVLLIVLVGLLGVTEF